MKALIFAAGKGTRLRPFTDSHPKALAPVNGIPLLERNIRYLQTFGISDFVINLHHFGDQIREFLQQNDNFGSSIEFSDESEMLLETGGGLLKAREHLQEDSDFLIMNADILTELNLKDLIKVHQDQKNLVTLAVSDRDSSRKLLFNSAGLLKGWINTSTGSEILAEPKEELTPLAFSGIHCVSREFLGKMTRTGAFSIMDEYLDLMKTQKIHGFKHQARLIDVGRPESVLEAERYFK